jgi:hypothetical protein
MGGSGEIEIGGRWYFVGGRRESGIGNRQSESSFSGMTKIFDP